MQEYKKFVFDVGLTCFASVANMLVGFIIIIVFGRYLGANDLGLYKMSTTIYGFLILIAGIGIPVAMIKYAAEFKEEKNKLNQMSSSGIITSLLIGIIFVVLIYLLSNIFAEIFKMPELSALLKILCFGFPFALVSGSFLGLLNGLREMKKYAAGTFLQGISMLVITLILMYHGFGIVGAVIGIVLSSGFSCFFLIVISRDYFNFTLEEYTQTSITLLRFGAKILTANAINEITNQMDIFLVGFFLLSADVGYYSVAISLSTFFWLIPMSVQTITFPATSSYWRENNHLDLHKMMDKSMKYCTILLSLAGLTFAFFGKNIIIILFKDEFVPAVLPLHILLIGTLIRGSIAQPLGGSLSAIGRPDLVMKICAFMLIINATLDFILIPRIGIVGAAIATTISLSSGATINLYLMIKHLSFEFDFAWYLKFIGVIILAMIIFALGTIFVDQMIIGGAIFIGYLFLIIRFFLIEDDISLIKHLMYSLKNGGMI